MGLIVLIEPKNARETGEMAFFSIYHTSHATEPSPKPNNHGTNIGRQRKLTADISPAAHRIIHQHHHGHGDGAIAAAGVPWTAPHHTQHHTSWRITMVVTVVVMVLGTVGEYHPRAATV